MKALLESVLGSKLLPWAIGLALVVAGTLIVIAKNRDNKLVQTGRDAGAASAVVEGQRDILKQVERANNAEQEVHRSGDAARFDRCVRNATPDTRANCERFRPLPD